MKTKKFIILNSIFIFLIATISHFIYDLFPNSFTAIFFPVNESIWEHMKLLFTPYLINLFVILIFNKKLNLVYHNLIFSYLPTSIFSIFLYLLIYLPIYNTWVPNAIFNIGLMIFVIFISQFILIYLSQKKVSNIITNLSIISIIIIYIIFGYLTYHPIKNYIFYDFSTNKYGINIYKLGN